MSKLKDLQDLIKLLDSQEIVLNIIRQAQEERGAGWLDHIKKTYPKFVFIIDLVANHTGAEAMTELKKKYPHIPFSLLENKILKFHGKLKAELEKKR